jgi:formylglycine-generating enzyme required for sulfatase activity
MSIFTKNLNTRKWFEVGEPIHTIYLDYFLMNKFEVTQKEFSRKTENNPSEFKGDLAGSTAM